MALSTKVLMDLFNDANRDALRAEDYDRAFVFSNAESLVNNFLHGRTPQDTFALVRTALVRTALVANSEAEFNSPDKTHAYLEAIALLDEYVDSL